MRSVRAIGGWWSARWRHWNGLRQRSQPADAQPFVMVTSFIWPVNWSPPSSLPPTFAAIDSRAVLDTDPIDPLAVFGLVPSTAIVSAFVVKVQLIVCHDPLASGFALNRDLLPLLPLA